MNNTPLVSVILNVYNGEDYVADAIRSVLEQTYTNLELIVADDASSDNTLSIIRSFDDPRLRCLTRTTRRHICYTINEALDQAKGGWIAHIDHDDIWEKDKLEKQMAYVLTHPEVGVCFSYVNLIGNMGQDVRSQYPDIYDLFHISFDTKKEWVRYLFFNLNCLCHPSSLIRADLMPRQDLFCRQLHDCLMWYQLIPKTEFYVYPEELVRYRWAITDEKASRQTRQNVTRTYNEMLITVKEDLIEGLSEQQFIEFFQEDFVNPASATPLELTIEKMFLFRRCGEALDGANALSARYLKEILRTEGGLELLERNYRFNLLNLYQETGEDLVFSPSTQAYLEGLCGERDNYRLQVSQLQGELSELYSCTSWRITRPLRSLSVRLRSMPHLMKFLRWGKRCLHRSRNGGKKTRAMRRELELWNQIWLDQGGNPLATPASMGCTQQEYESQKSVQFPRDITFSILVPLYNTPEQFLREMIASVQNQTYPRWELCLSDGSDADHSEVEQVCRELAAGDSRIHYQKLEHNLGISGNTNACIELATGDYIGLFDHDDLLHPSALYENMVAICEQGADFLYTDEATFESPHIDQINFTHYKPDFAPDTLRSYNYICHFTVFSKALMDEIGRFRPECDGSQDYDMILRLTEKAHCIVHIPKVLYFWRASAASTASDIRAKTYIMDAAKRALSDHLSRVGLKGTVTDAAIPSVYKINYAISDQPLISILIPSYEHQETLKRCIDSIITRTTYPNYEIVIVENNSKEPATFQYYDELQKDPRIRIVTWKGKFNFSSINNFGFRATKGDYILMLNNDIEVITPNWLEEMLMYAQRPDVGAVGAMLYYPTDKVQHAGIILGIGGVAGHAHKYFPRGSYGYSSRMCLAQNLSAVTAACLMVSRSVYQSLHGLDESFEVAFNDVDFCMRIRRAGYLIVWTPFAELYHFESESRGLEDTPEKQRRFHDETTRFKRRWGAELAAGDPYYNPNFTLEREDFSLRANDRRR